MLERSDAHHSSHWMISLNRLRDRKSAFVVHDRMLPSAAIKGGFVVGATIR